LGECIEEGANMAPALIDDVRASQAFIEALRRATDMIFSKEEIIISEKMKIGDPVVCTIEAHRENGDSSQASGKAYIYSDLIVVCVESVCKSLMEPIYLHHYEYLSY
jgi:hypothetical protein